MAAPGWYRIDSDPAGTKRYWDGTKWLGEPTSDAAANQVIHYAAAPETEIDLGDIARRVSISESRTPTSPYSASATSVNVRPRRPMPEALKTLTILVCVLKALPLLRLGLGLLGWLGVFGVAALDRSTSERYGPPGIEFDVTVGASILILLAMFILGSGLLIIQIRSLLNNDASSLFSVALVLVCIDVLATANQWVATSQGNSYNPTLLFTGVLVLQTIVAVWAGVQTRRKIL